MSCVFGDFSSEISIFFVVILLTGGAWDERVLVCGSLVVCVLLLSIIEFSFSLSLFFKFFKSLG